MRTNRFFIATSILTLLSALLIPGVANASVPGTIQNPHQRLPIQRTAADITFQAPASETAITSYDIQVSDDAGITYSKSYRATDTRTTVILEIPIPEASLRLVKVRARSNDDVGAWSTPFEVKTKGGRPQRVYIQTPNGTPVVGGSVTWDMVDGSARSSKTYGLTASGYIDFPQAPSGEVHMTLTNGELPDGVLVTGEMTAVLGYASTILQIPQPPAAAHVVEVVLPNGLPVSNASVSVNSTDMTDSTTLQGFTFDLPNSNLLPVTTDVSSGSIDNGSGNVDENTDDTSIVIDPANYDEDYWDYSTFDYWEDADPTININIYGLRQTRRSFTGHDPMIKNNVVVDGDVVASGTTNTMGRFMVQGFTNTVPTATVSFDDGTVSQTQSVQLNQVKTTVELDFIPYLAATTTSFTVPENSAVSVPIVAVDTSEVSQLRLTSMGKMHNLRQSRHLKATPGVKFKIIAPKGAKLGSCKKLAKVFTTAANGRATGKVCATKSGNYKIVSNTHGVLSMGAVKILVKGAPSTPVTKLVGKSAGLGKLSVSWNKPEYTGGAAIKKYVVTAKAPGTKAIISSTSGLTSQLSGLSHTKHYTITVTAVTRNGTSDPASIRVPVA